MAGRKDKYSTHILPFLNDIDKWLNDGASERNIAKQLGVAYSSWNNYKVKYEELRVICEKPRSKLVDDLRSALVKKALGFEYEEKKTYKKIDSDGKEYTYIEIVKRQSLPDTTAIFGALNLYDDDYVKDRKQYDLQKKELELRKLMAESKDW